MKIAIRSLFRRPGFAAVAIITLAVGTGGNTAIFSTVNAVLLQDLSYPDPDQLFAIGTEMVDGRATTGGLAPASLTRFREATDLFQNASGTFRVEGVLLDDESNPIRATAYGVMPRFFDVFNVPLTLGRGFTDEEHDVGGPQEVVLAHHLWEAYFGSDPGIVGRSVRFAGESRVVVGVAPRGFAFPDGADVWLNLQLDPQMQGNFLDGFVRTQPGVGEEELHAGLGPIERALARDFPQANTGRVFSVESLLESSVGELGPTVMMLLGASAILLLIACVNVTNLLLSRGTARAREIALHLALGAGRGGVIKQLVMESLVLAAFGAVIGLALAAIGVRVLLVLGARDLPRLNDVPIDGTVLLFALGTAALVGLLVGFTPAIRLAGTDLKTLVNEGGRGNSGGPGQARVFKALVVSEVALAVVLVVGAGLLMRSFAGLRSADPGFVSDRLVLFDLQLPRTSYPDYDRVADFYRDLQERLAGVSGVEAVASATTFPLAGELDFMMNAKREDEPMPETGQEVRARLRQVSPSFFQTLGLRLVEGRTLEPRDRRDTTPVAVVDEEFVRQFFPEGSPVGRRVEILTDVFLPGARGYNELGSRPDAPYEIVGVVANTKFRSLRQPPEATVYLPQDQAPFRRQHIALRTRGDDATSVAAAIRREVQDMDPLLPVEIRSFDTIVDGTMARDRLSMALLGMFGSAALLLAGVGIYGVMAYAVVQRTGEIAIREALGAAPPDIRSLILREGFQLGAIGIVVGLVAAALVSRGAASQLYAVSALDPMVFVAVPLVLVVIIALATLIPALRAMRVDPVVMLRSE